MVALSRPATIKLPNPAIAPGFRDSIRGMSQFSLHEITNGYGVIKPAEGLGTIYPYFTAHKLCDASTTISPDTFALLRQHPAWDTGGTTPRTQPDGDPDPDWRTKLLEHADDLFNRKRLLARRRYGWPSEYVRA